MSKDMNPDSLQQFGLLCFVMYLYSPEVKQNLNQFSQIQKVLLLFSRQRIMQFLCAFFSHQNSYRETFLMSQYMN